MSQNPEISIILPCLNEEKGVSFCIEKIEKVIRHNNLNAEIIVVDNASTDKTADIVRQKMQSLPYLRLETESVRGYGSAYLCGLNNALGRYFYMADADGTYDFNDIPAFIAKLRSGADMVIGNRFSKGFAKGTMPWLHQYIGNPVLSWLVRLFFKVKVHDCLCGARAMSKESFLKIGLYAIGMEFAFEMIIKASKADQKIAEIPTKYSPRIGESKLRSFADGWRYLRFILLYSPLALFLLPGFILFVMGAASMAILYFSHLTVFNVQLYVHPMFLSSIILITGYQLVLFGGFAKSYAVSHLGDANHWIESMFRYFTIEKAGLIGILLTLSGAWIYLFIFIKWQQSGYGSLDEIKNSIVALTLSVIGVQTFFSAFMLSIIGIKERRT